MRKTHRISWMMSGWIREAPLDGLEGGTAAATIGCPDEFYAVRLGFPNTTRSPWTLTKVIGAASQGYGNFIEPVGPAAWVPFTFAMEGQDDDRLVTRADAPTLITVAPTTTDRATGAEAEPHWSWTDWTPLASAGPDESGMHVLMLRGLVPANQTICYAAGQMRTLSRNRSLTKGFDFFVGGLKFNNDRVNDLTIQHSDSLAEHWAENALVGGNIFTIVQFLTKNSGIVGLVTGDSHQQGTSTTEQFNNFLYAAIVSYGSENIGRVPVGMVNCAVGGLTSDQFFARLSSLIRAVKPSFVVLPGWTYNDADQGVHANTKAVQQFSAKLLMAIELCRSHDCIPVCLTPFPRDVSSMTDIQLGPWQALRTMIMEGIGRDTIVLDATSILGMWEDGRPSGTYLEEMSTDGSHPDDVGHYHLGEKIRSLIGAINSQSEPTRLTLRNEQLPSPRTA